MRLKALLWVGAASLLAGGCGHREDTSLREPVEGEYARLVVRNESGRTLVLQPTAWFYGGDKTFGEGILLPPTPKGIGAADREVRPFVDVRRLLAFREREPLSDYGIGVGEPNQPLENSFHFRFYRRLDYRQLLAATHTPMRLVLKKDSATLQIGEERVSEAYGK